MCALKPEVDLRCVLQKTVSFDSLNYIEDATNAPAIPVEDFKFGYSQDRHRYVSTISLPENTSVWSAWSVLTKRTKRH